VSRRTPLPRPIGSYPTVRFAVRLWAINGVIGAMAAGTILAWIVILATFEIVKEGFFPSPPPKVEAPAPVRPQLTRQENWRYREPNRDDPPQVWFRKLTPPPGGYVYDENYHLIRIPGEKIAE
jgi:hypothetical protein